MTRSKTHVLILITALGIACVPLTAAAEEMDPEAVIKYRQGIMRAQGGLMAAMAQVVRGKVAFEASLPILAKNLTGLSKDVTALFPEGSDFGETEAKKAVWEQWKEFEQSAADAHAAAEDFEHAVQTGNGQAVRDAFKQVADSCKACHKEFREEE